MCLASSLSAWRLVRRSRRSVSTGAARFFANLGLQRFARGLRDDLPVVVRFLRQAFALDVVFHHQIADLFIGPPEDFCAAKHAVAGASRRALISRKVTGP